MHDNKPVHIPRDRYPEATYPPVLTVPAPSSSNDDKEIDFLDYIRVIVVRRWTILAILFTVVTATLVWTYRQIPIYRASASLQIDRENPNVVNFKEVYTENAADDTLRTQFEVLKSRLLARRVIEDLKLDREEEFKPGKPGLLSSYLQSLRALWVTQPTTVATEPAEPDRLRPLIGAYISRLQVAPVPLSRLVNVSFESQDPELAARVINAHANHFIEQNLQFKVDATEIASDFLSQRVVSLQANLEKADERLQAYSREHAILFTDEKQNTTIQKLQQLETEYTKAQAERVQKESYEGLVRVGNTEVLAQLMGSPLIAQLASRVAELRREESELEVTFSPEYPRRKRIRSQIEEIERAINDEKNRVVQTVQAEHTAALERERLLGVALEAHRNEVNRVNQEIIQYNILKREVESSRQLYDGLLTRLKEAGISAGLRASNIRIVDRAEIPRSPVKPRKTFNLILSLMVGLALGVGLAFVQEYLDNSIKSPDDVTRYLNLPTLGMIPMLQSLAGKRGYRYGYSYGSRQSQSSETPLDAAAIDLIAYQRPTSLMAEAFRSVRTSLLLSSADHAPQSILVTSSSPSEGKTVTAVNLAISLTQTGSRVLLIDADMRKPRIHSVLSVGNGVGLSSFLTGSAPMKDVVFETSVPNLLVIPCGTIPPNPSELLLSNRFRIMLQSVREYFAYVVVDSPPVTNVSDARIVAAETDATVLVVKALTTSRYQVRHAMEKLAEARGRLVGVILNDVDVRLRSAYHSYYSYYPAQYHYYGAEPGSETNLRPPSDRG